MTCPSITSHDAPGGPSENIACMYSTIHQGLITTAMYVDTAQCDMLCGRAHTVAVISDGRWGFYGAVA